MCSKDDKIVIPCEGICKWSTQVRQRFPVHSTTFSLLKSRVPWARNQMMVNPYVCPFVINGSRTSTAWNVTWKALVKNMTDVKCDLSQFETIHSLKGHTNYMVKSVKCCGYINILVTRTYMQAVSNDSFCSIAFTWKLNGAYRHVLHICDYELMLLFFGVGAENIKVLLNYCPHVRTSTLICLFWGRLSITLYVQLIS